MPSHFTFLVAGSLMLWQIAHASPIGLRAAEPRLSKEQVDQLLAQCASEVHPLTMESVLGVESNRYPLRINVNGKQQLSRQPLHVAEAVSTADWLERAGYSFDVGLGQLNNANVKKYGLSWASAFEPCTNLRVASDILVRNFKTSQPKHADDQAAILRALSKYNTGNATAGFKNGYVQKVKSRAGQIIQQTRKRDS